MPASSPTRSWARRALFQLHLWVGLLVGAYVLAICVSGSVLVFAPQLGAAAHPSLRAVPVDVFEDARSRGARVLTADEAIGAARQALPGRRLLNVQIAPSPRHAHIVGLLDGREYRVVFVHPLTGTVSAPVHARGAVIGWLERLHSNFFAGRAGRVANGIGGLLLVFLGLSGAIVWWPGRGRVRRALRVDWRAGWKRVVFDLHNAVGIWLLLPVLLLALTGVYFTWPQVYRDAISRLSPVTRERPVRSTRPTPSSSRLPVDVVIKAARRQVPDLPWMRVDLPGDTAAPFTVVATLTAEGDLRHGAMLAFDQYSGALLALRRGSQARTPGDAVVAWIPPLHTGHFGGMGVHVTWAVLGLVPVGLLGTGVLMWWHRVVVPWRRRGRRARRTVDA